MEKPRRREKKRIYNVKFEKNLGGIFELIDGEMEETSDDEKKEGEKDCSWIDGGLYVRRSNRGFREEAPVDQNQNYGNLILIAIIHIRQAGTQEVIEAKENERTRMSRIQLRPAAITLA